MVAPAVPCASCLCDDDQQGASRQTLQRVGVFLPEPCFSHGQLYVAASRVGLPVHIRFAVACNAQGEYRTHNVVYPEALTI